MNYTYYEGTHTGVKYKPGITFGYKIAVPDNSDRDLGLLVEHDGLNQENANAILDLAEQGKAPLTIYSARSDRYPSEGLLTHAYLHSLPGEKNAGAIDMDVDENDRLFVLTTMGIQCVRSFGLIDGILDLPDDFKPCAVAVENSVLYLKTSKGYYCRKLVVRENGRKFAGYYD